jgi:hypothetical protein
MWAVDAIVNHWDGFVFSIMNNYRIYHDPSTDRWSVLPSGVDQTFTTGLDRSAFEVDNVVARLCVADPACEAAFAAKLRQGLEALAAADLPALARATRDRIAADVMADPRREGSYDQFLAQVDATITFIEGRAATIEQDLAAHGY